MYRLALALVALVTCVWLMTATITQGQDTETKGKVVNIPIANETGEPIFFFVCGSHGSTGKQNLDTTGIITIPFYEDGNERALDAFEKDGKKLISHFKFVPGAFCLLIEKNQTHMKQAPAGSKTATVEYKGKTR